MNLYYFNYCYFQCVLNLDCQQQIRLLRVDPLVSFLFCSFICLFLIG
jgi:hypothetical protein